ncbi:hypothetical protein [Pseudomonas syringae]|uniref:hypothetical protein n=1 Tax=Pseudomonas syringae TaxID=317 RepID=UPI001F110FCB|nr:hypothetical protein [Pseudomonas syringae]MCH5508839.1 hypothetical protein [Pseudomonas syringae pv. syringae]MCH5637658.1 hypothetical protein [Pseudomonas syringae pv. syringae]MCH7426791.1 hypothetical protein [Pseudomonas syringae pv. syringae]
MTVDIEKVRALAEVAKSGGAELSALSFDTDRIYSAEYALIELYEGVTPAVVLELVEQYQQLSEDLITFKATISALGEATKKLVICARTTGGTAGPDKELMEACEAAESTISLVGVSRVIDALDDLRAENEALREIISESATACGAAVSVDCSLEFMAMLPAEIGSVVGRLRKSADRYEWLRAETGDGPNIQVSEWIGPHEYRLFGEELDQTIDQQLSKEAAR